MGSSRAESHWVEYSLPEVIDFREGPGIMARDFRPSGVPLIRLAGLGKTASLLDGCDHLDPEDVAKRWSHFRVEVGDVLISTSASLGRVARVGPDGVGAVPYTRIIRMRPSDDRLDAGYLEYVLQGQEFQSQVEAMGVGSVMRHFGPSHLRRMTVLLPSPTEQRAIQAVLRSLDDKIELNRRLAQTAHELAHAIFRSRYRSNDPALPQEPLGEHVEVARGLSYTGAGLADEGMPLHNLNSIYEGGGYKRDGIKFYAGDYKERHIVEVGELVVANTEQGFEELLIACPALVSRRFGETGLFSHHLYRVRPKPTSPLSAQFLSLMLLPGHLRTEVAGYANGTTVNMLPVDALGKPRIAVPPRALVEAVDALVTPLFDRAEAAEDESETLADLRDTLLPKLISGEIRLRDGDPGDREGQHRDSGC